jgi:hypothetical protein
MATTNLTDLEAQAKGQRFADSPQTYTGAVSEVEKFATKLQEGSPVSGLKESSESKMKELFDFDRQLESGYDPLKTQRESIYGGDVVQHPMDTYMPASRSVGEGAGYVSDLFSAIGQYKSLEGEQLNSALSTLMNFIDMQVKNKQRAEDRAWDIYKFEKEMGLKSRGTTEERATSESLAALKRDVERGVPFYELYPRYKDTGLEEWQIREEYNKGPLAAKEGPAKEPSGELRGVAEPSKLSQSEIEAGLTGYETTAERNQKLAEYEYQKTDITEQIKTAKNEGYTRKQIEDYIKEKTGGIIAQSYQNAINEVYGQAEEKKGVWESITGVFKK